MFLVLAHISGCQTLYFAQFRLDLPITVTQFGRNFSEVFLPDTQSCGRAPAPGGPVDAALSSSECLRVTWTTGVLAAWLFVGPDWEEDKNHWLLNDKLRLAV